MSLNYVNYCIIILIIKVKLIFAIILSFYSHFIHDYISFDYITYAELLT